VPQPLAIDLYCGLGGWAEGFLAEGYTWYDSICHIKPPRWPKDSCAMSTKPLNAGSGQGVESSSDMGNSSSPRAILRRWRTALHTLSSSARSLKVCKCCTDAMCPTVLTQSIFSLERRLRTWMTCAQRSDGDTSRATKAAARIQTPSSQIGKSPHSWPICEMVGDR